MGLQMPFVKDDRRLSEMGLKMPSKEYDGESSEVGLKMPSKIDADFIRILFVGILVPAIRGGVCWGMFFRGIESRSFGCPLFYWGVISTKETEVNCYLVKIQDS